MLRRSRNALVGVTLLAGCASASATGNATPAVVLTMSRSAYVAGDRIVVVRTNVGPVALESGNPGCGVALENRRDSDGSWQTVTADPRVCTAEMIILALGASDSVVYLSDASLPTGRYRLSMPSPVPKLPASVTTLFTAEFMVTAR